MSALSLPDRLRQLAELVEILSVAGVTGVCVVATHTEARLNISSATLNHLAPLLSAAAVFGATDIEWAPDGSFWQARLVGGPEGIIVQASVSPYHVPPDVLAKLCPVPAAASVVVPL